MFFRGDGKDTILNADSDAVDTKPDKLVFGGNIVAGNITARRYYYDLILEIKGTSDSVTIQSYFDEDTVANHGYAIDQIVFSDGSFWAIQDVKAIVQQTSESNDIVWGDLGTNTLDGKGGDDILYGLQGDDSLAGGDGNDELWGGDGNDTLRGGAGNDTLNGGIDNDTLLGDAGDDHLLGNSGNDFLDGGAGNDQLEGEDGSDTYRFARGWGIDTVINLDSKIGNVDSILFDSDITASDIKMSRVDRDLVITFVGSQDRLSVYHFFDESGNYQIDQIRFVDGLTWSADQIKAIVTQGTPQNDNIKGYDSDDVIDGLAGDDQIAGGAGNDELRGGDGNDTIAGGDGDDTLDGGHGKDLLSGGVGSDTYIYGRAYGNDRIDNSHYSSLITDVDTIKLAGLNPDDVTLRYDNSNLVITILDTREELTVVSNFASNDDIWNYAIDQIVFADGTIWRLDEIRDSLLRGTDDDDDFVGNETDDHLTGLGGADRLSGAAGNDWLEGGSGRDTLIGGSGNDRLFGGAGNDSLGGDEGDDFLDGGSGNDFLSGGRGSDTYVFRVGSGNDVLDNSAYGDAITGKLDTIRLDGISSSGVSISRSKNDLIIRLSASGETLVVTSHFLTGSDAYGYFIDQIQFGDGAIWDKARIASEVLVGHEDADVILGYDSADNISGGAGNDKLNGGSGNDLINGDAGDDVVDGGTGSDKLFGGDGNDQLIGGDGDDILEGGSGDDSLAGGFGSDTYLFGVGSGRDTITNTAYGDTTVNKTDSIKLISLSSSQIELRRELDDLIITILATGETLRVGAQFADAPGYGTAVDKIVFADGEEWAGSEILQHVSSNPSTEPKYVYGSDSGETLVGGVADDYIYGQGGDDILDGNIGNDALIGGDGNDIFVFERGSGLDEIYAYDSNVDKFDIIEFRGLTPEEVVLTRQANNLVFYIKGTQDRLIAYYHFESNGASGAQISEIRFDDGTIWDASMMLSKSNEGTEFGDSLTGTTFSDNLNGLGGDDSLEGNEGNDTLKGGDGVDRLYGGDGDDVLDGGQGADYLDSGAGNDTYIFHKGDGQDTIASYESNLEKHDSLIFQDLSANDVSITRQGSDLLFSVKQSTDKLIVQNHFAGVGKSGYEIDTVRFSDGVEWDMDAINAQALKGTDNDDTLNGYATDDSISGGNGNDTINGGDGADSLDGGSDDDALNGEGGNDILSGGSGADILNGGAGNDILDGGKGNDQLNGGDGDDTYAFGLGYGLDSINAYENRTGKVDTIKIINVKPDDVVMHRDYDNLVISFLTSPDTLHVWSHFIGESTAGYQVDRLIFEDGTIWDQSVIKAKSLKGSDNDDNITGYVGSDVIEGGRGDDTLSGAQGDDFLYGGEGSDYLTGGDDNDVLDGGQGDDRLDGGNGDDTYVFGKGYGQDVVYYAYDGNPTKNDTIYLKDFNKEDVSISRDNEALLIQVKAASDSFRVWDHFMSQTETGYRIDGIQFANGELWDRAQINAQALAAASTDGDDFIRGYATADTIYAGSGDDSILGDAGDDYVSGGGGADFISAGEGNDTVDGDLGNDTIYGENGADRLTGGKGNDVLDGGSGDDIYYFDADSGIDTINNYGTGDIDTIQYTSSLEENDLWFRHIGNDLEVSVINTQDKVTVKNWYSGSDYHVDKLVLSNDKVLLDSQVQNLVDSMAAFGVPVGAEGSLTASQQSQLDSVLAANWK